MTGKPTVTTEIPRTPHTALGAPALLWVDLIFVLAGSAWAFALLLIDWPRFALMLLAIERWVWAPWFQPPTPLYTWQSAIRGSAEAAAGLAIALIAFILIGRLASCMRLVRGK